MLPNRVIVSAYLARNFQLWVFARLGISTVFLLAKTDPLRLAPLTMCAIAMCSAMISVLEIYRRAEFDLLGNLAVGWRAIGVLSLAPPLVGELLIYVIMISVA